MKYHRKHRFIRDHGVRIIKWSVKNEELKESSKCPA
jgi:hypothetical protein